MSALAPPCPVVSKVLEEPQVMAGVWYVPWGIAVVAATVTTARAVVAPVLYTCAVSVYVSAVVMARVPES